MNLSICKDKENVVKGVLQVIFDRSCDLIEHMGEVGRPRKPNLWQVLPIDCCDTLSSVYFRLFGVAIQGETVRGTCMTMLIEHETWDASETIDREVPIIVIHLKDRAHC